MRGNRMQKHPSLLLGHRRARELVAVGERPELPAPRAPAGLLPASQKRWRELWHSRVARAWDRESDRGGLERYILAWDKWRRYEVLVAQVPLVKGSKGQLRANPLAVRMDALEGQLRQLEEQYGLTPVSRVRLGIELVEGQHSLLRLEQYLSAGEDDDKDAVMVL